MATKNVRGGDHVDYTLTLSSKEGPPQILFKGATCYGFRNLQNVVRRVGREKGLSNGRPNLALVRKTVVRRRKGDTSPVDLKEEAQRGYDYIEVMACPSGCVNGGGQLPAPSAVSPSQAIKGTHIGEIDAEGLPRVLEALLPWSSMGRDCGKEVLVR